MNFLASLQPKERAHAGGAPAADADDLFAISRLDADESCQRLGSSIHGLTADDATQRLQKFGHNLVTRERKPTIPQEIWSRARNPLNALLLTLAGVSYFLGDVRAAVVIALMVILAISTAFIQEHRSNEAAARLRAMVKTTASVRRGAIGAVDEFREVPIEMLVPGDIVRLSAGDMIPADLRLIEAKDLFVNQSALTGEAMPAEKFAHRDDHTCDGPFDLPNMCFMGANVVSGYATAIIVRTGGSTFFGRLADEIAGRRVLTAFDQGINRFTWLMIRFIIVMVPAVFLINGFTSISKCRHFWESTKPLPRLTKFRSILCGDGCRSSSRMARTSTSSFARGRLRKYLLCARGTRLTAQPANSTSAILRSPRKKPSPSTRMASGSWPSPTRHWTLPSRRTPSLMKAT